MTTSRRLARLLVVLATALASLVLAAPAAQATWHDSGRIHGGVLQACARVVDASRVEVRIRFDNRRGAHTHLGALTADDGRRRVVRAAAGRVSVVRALVVPRSSEVDLGYGEAAGESAGESRTADSVGRC